jgi:hypothetical protein
MSQKKERAVMNKQILTILIGFFWTSSILGQVQYDVKKVLETKDFLVFKKFADNLSDKKKGIYSHWVCLRDLTTDFKEGVFCFRKEIPDKDNPSISSVYFFRVTLIATKKSIVYYELSEEKNKKVGKDWAPYYALIGKFKDDKAFSNLKNSFKSIFQTNLNENELFVTDFVYGEHCGIVGENPIGRQQIEKWVVKKDKAQLLKWLKSANTEKQVYAIDGLYQLKKVGIMLTDEELEIIKFVINKNGTMYVCSGCLHYHEEINSVTENLNNDR